MDNFVFYSPTWFEFGKDAELQTGKLVKKFGGTKVFIHYGGGSVIKSGLLDRVKKSLDDEGIPYVELGGVKPNPLSDLVREGIEICRKEKVDFVLPVGGGSTIDSAKAIAFGTLYDGDFWDYYNGKCYPVTEALPVGTVLTIAATGSEASGDAVVTNIETNAKRCTDGDPLKPIFSVMNPAITQTLPPYQTASGAADMMSHCMERYFSASEDVEITDRLLEATMLTVMKEVKRCLADTNNYEARANLMWAGTIAHNNITGVGRLQDWGTHHMENELSTNYGCSHGEGLAILTPYWMTYCIDHKMNLNPFVKFAVRVMGCEMNVEDPEETAREGVKRLRTFFDEIGMANTIKAIGGKKGDERKLAEGMFFEAPNHGNFLKLSVEIAEEIYAMAMGE